MAQLQLRLLLLLVCIDLCADILLPVQVAVTSSVGSSSQSAASALRGSFLSDDLRDADIWMETLMVQNLPPAAYCFIKRAADRQSDLRLMILLLSIDRAAARSPISCWKQRQKHFDFYLCLFFSP